MKIHKKHKIKELSLTERRQIENEVVFRKANEQIQNELIKIEKMAKEEDL
ncbi:hypothetical protein H0V99_03525 [Candidatus Saccharibacteria bacterium]|nr:hypothetical protein [Candidatus Saccharibacteria bacterium]